MGQQKILGMILMGLVSICVLLILLEQVQQDNSLIQPCAMEDPEIVYVTVTITVSPQPRPPHPLQEWRTSFHCVRNPDFSEICFYKNLCFDGRHGVYFLEPTLYEEDKEDLGVAEEAHPFMSDALNPKKLRFPVSHPPSTGFVPYSVGITDHIQAFRVSPDREEVVNAIVKDEPVYLAFQRDTTSKEVDILYLMESNIMLYEVQRLNVTFGEFMDYPTLSKAYLLRPRLDENSLPADLIDLFVTKETSVSYWEDLDEIGVGSDRFVCMKSAVIIGSKPQFYSGASEGEDFKSRVYAHVGLPRPDPRGFDRGPNFQPTVTIYNPVGEKGAWTIANLDSLTNILEHYNLRYSVVGPLPKDARLKDYGKLFHDTDVLISPHNHFQINYMWLGVHVSVIEIIPASVINNQYEMQAKVLMLNYQSVRSWLPAPKPNTIEVPLREMELAIIESFDLQAHSIRGEADHLYIHSEGVTFKENDWYQ